MDHPRTDTDTDAADRDADRAAGRDAEAGALLLAPLADLEPADPPRHTATSLVAGRQLINYESLDTLAGGPASQLTVELFAAGGHWELPDLSNDPNLPPASKGIPDGRPGPTIQGRPSRVDVMADATSVFWQWAPG